jgi:hypothetical protein
MVARGSTRFMARSPAPMYNDAVVSLDRDVNC